MACGCKKRNVEQTVVQTPINEVNVSGNNFPTSGSTNPDEISILIEKIKKLNNK